MNLLDRQQAIESCRFHENMSLIEVVEEAKNVSRAFSRENTEDAFWAIINSLEYCDNVSPSIIKERAKTDIRDIAFPEFPPYYYASPRNTPYFHYILIIPMNRTLQKDRRRVKFNSEYDASLGARSHIKERVEDLRSEISELQNLL